MSYFIPKKAATPGQPVNSQVTRMILRSTISFLSLSPHIYFNGFMDNVFRATEKKATDGCHSWLPEHRVWGLLTAAACVYYEGNRYQWWTIWWYIDYTRPLELLETHLNLKQNYSNSRYAYLEWGSLSTVTNGFVLLTQDSSCHCIRQKKRCDFLFELRNWTQ